MPSTTSHPVFHDSEDRTAINLDILSKHCQGNMAFSLALMQELENSAENHLETIRSHAEFQNLSGVGEAAHSLKGAAAILGAEHLAELAERIESGSAEGNRDRIKILIQELDVELSRCLEQILQIRTNGQVSPSGPQ
ncbi:Hpt domain-containing protein [Pirellula sp. SH-Sr6A]|uniref:Hpt domain-containing protein n=1 Tax=Pirellula sp. SH-Sr6A TaxID=1632865 RepID=UPI00143AD9E4|nr:Hpt domain-containing protein [Pirellula sp. SH-Sr6A]